MSQTCPNCLTEVISNSSFCSKCGARIPPKSIKIRSSSNIHSLDRKVLIVLGVALAIWFIYKFTEFHAHKISDLANEFKVGNNVGVISDTSTGIDVFDLFKLENVKPKIKSINLLDLDKKTLEINAVISVDADEFVEKEEFERVAKDLLRSKVDFYKIKENSDDIVGVLKLCESNKDRCYDFVLLPKNESVPSGFYSLGDDVWGKIY